MRRMNRTIAIGVSASLLLGGCAPAAGTNEQGGTQVETLATEAAAEETAVRSTLAKIDDTKWCYDEANLALALENYGATVDYSFVWGQGHTMAERSGDATSNFIDWVNSCV